MSVFKVVACTYVRTYVGTCRKGTKEKNPEVGKVFVSLPMIEKQNSSNVTDTLHKQPADGEKRINLIFHTFFKPTEARSYRKIGVAMIIRPFN